MRVASKAVWPNQDRSDDAKIDTSAYTANGLCAAWEDSNGAPPQGSLVGQSILPFEAEEPCCLCFRTSAPSARGLFVTARLGPLAPNGLISKVGSVKVTGDVQGGTLAHWAFQNVPMQKMASMSPMGLLGCRLKIWGQSRLSRYWIGRTLPFAVPMPVQRIKVGELELVVVVLRGIAAEASLKHATRTFDLKAGLPVRPDNQQSHLSSTDATSDVPDTLAPDCLGILASEALCPACGNTGKDFLGNTCICGSSEVDGLTGPLAGSELGGLSCGSQVQPYHLAIKVIGHDLLQAALCRQWGMTMALLQEVRLAPEELQQQVCKEKDGTRRTLLRLCVDGLRHSRPPPLQAVEGGRIIALLGARRPYWWTFNISSVCHRTLSLLGETRVGMPRSSHSLASVGSRPWTAPHGVPSWTDCQWSDTQACQGQIHVDNQSGQQLGQLTMDGVELNLTLSKPGETVTFGIGSFRNPCGFPVLAARGRITGILATAVFDLHTSARLAAEMQTCGPSDVAALAVTCGADPRALADDGLSPYTMCLLGVEDPCGLLASLDQHLRERMRNNDPVAWAEAARSTAGCGHADLVAAPLARGLAVPDELAASLLRYCFNANLPLLATRVLTRVDGQQHLLMALERGESPQWLRVAERILQQTRARTPVWCKESTLEYALSQIRRGRQQFRLLVGAFLKWIRNSDLDYYSCPASLGDGGAECPICFEPLWRGTPVALAGDDGHAICPHFLHGACARGYAASANSTESPLRCPECRRSGVSVAPMPSLLEDPLGWFDFLAQPPLPMRRATLLRAISAMLPVDADELATAMDENRLLQSMVKEEVTAAEFLAGGLYAWVRRHAEEHWHGVSRGPAPELRDRTAWFRYWDFNQSGMLDRGQVLRAMLKTFEVSSLDVKRVDELKRQVDGIWDRYVADRKFLNGHCSVSGITCDEFCCDGGLGDHLEEAFSLDLAGLARATSPEVSTSFNVGASANGRRIRRTPRRMKPQTSMATAPSSEVAAAAEALQNLSVGAQGLSATSSSFPQRTSSSSSDTQESHAADSRRWPDIISI